MLFLHFPVILFSQSEAKASISRVWMLAGEWRFNTEGNVAGCPGDERGRCDSCPLAAGSHTALPGPSGSGPAAVGSRYLSRDVPLMLAARLAARGDASPCRCARARARCRIQVVPGQQSRPFVGATSSQFSKAIRTFFVYRL